MSVEIPFNLLHNFIIQINSNNHAIYQDDNNKMANDKRVASQHFKLKVCLLSILFVGIDNCNCSPRGTKSATPETDIIITLSKEEFEASNDGLNWTDNVINKLQKHMLKVISDLEGYLVNRYLPYLQVISTDVDFHSFEIDGGMNSRMKSMLRLSTLHAYLIIYQSALVDAAIKIFTSYLKEQQANKGEDYKLSDEEFVIAIRYLNYQIRVITLADKSEYLNEFAYICSMQEGFDPETTTDEVERLVFYLQLKTNDNLNKIQRDKDEFMAIKGSVPASLKKALYIEDHRSIVDKVTGDFLKKQGLESIISAYLFMSHDDSLKSKIPRKFDFKKYFKSCRRGDEDKIIGRSKLKNDVFDPILPLDLNTIESPKRKEVDRIFDGAAVKRLSIGFHKEMVERIIPFQTKELETLKNIIEMYDPKLIEILAEHDNDCSRTRRARIKLIEQTSAILIRYQMLKMNALDRFIKLAINHIGYQEGTEEFQLNSPFNDKMFALTIQKLLFAFYPVLINGGSLKTSGLERFDIDSNKACVDNVGNKIQESSELSNRLDKLYELIRKFKKREDVTSNVGVFRLRTEVDTFRALSIKSKGFYVALNGFALGHVLALVVEPTYNEMHNMYDLIQSQIISCLLRDDKQRAVVVDGKHIESNVMRWQIITPNTVHREKD